MEWHVFKHLVNEALDERAGGHMPDLERERWWTSPQGGVRKPYLLLFGSEEDKQAVLQAARAS